MRGKALADRILVADDQTDIVDALRLLLKGAGFTVQAADSPSAVLEAVVGREWDCVLMDLNYTRDTTSGTEGMDLLRALREVDGTLPVVTMTAWGSVEGAVEAMRRGAGDYVEKPWDNQRLVATLKTQIELGRARRRGQRLTDANRREELVEGDDFVATSQAMRPVLDLIASVGHPVPGQGSRPLRQGLGRLQRRCHGYARTTCLARQRARTPARGRARRVGRPRRRRVD